ncbi:MAG: hypothetical protein ACREAA_00880 [Candidatus Polarisedimenticolia bacterium]
MSLLAAFALAAGLTATEAPPFTLYHAPGHAAEAKLVAERAPVMAEDLRRRLEAPPLPPSTLCLLDQDTSVAPASVCDSALAMPEWAAGIAVPSRHEIVVRLDRVGRYPHRQLLSVVAHETVHLLEGDARTPPWFREGVAALMAHQGEWMDSLYLLGSPVASAAHPLDELGARFRTAGGTAEARVAYAGSFSFLTFLVRRHGDRLPARVLEDLRAGASFEEAFAHATGGVSLREEEQAWAESMNGPLRWLAVAGESWALWLMLALLMITGWLVKRRRTRRILARWEEQETEQETLDGL